MKIQYGHVMKRLAGGALLVLSLAVQQTLYADEDVLQAFIDTRDTSPSLTLGRTRSDLTQCIKWAEEYGIPLVAIWSNEGCAHCERLERAMTSAAFQAHAKASGLIICAVFNSDGKGSIKTSDPEGVRNGPGYHWCWGQGNSKIYKSISMFPFVRFYWKKNGKQIVDVLKTGDQVDNNIGTDVSTGVMTDEFGTYETVAGKSANKAGIYSINYMQKMFPGYEPIVINSYSGGVFSFEESEGNRLEVESATKEVTFELVRSGNAIDVATNNVVELVAPDGAVVQSVTVNWAAGQESTNVTVDASLAKFTADGQRASILVKDLDGEAKATNHIYFVSREPSASNPLWLGERKSPGAKSAVPDLQFGEWTVDIDGAKELVENASGDAYTLVSVQGSLWCPDCANTERNFLDMEDDQGNNRFCAWAKAHNVALVSMDIPNYRKSESTVKTVASPTLFSRKAFETTLARTGEYPQSGADAALTNKVMRSGLGYLTRKGVDDAQAERVMQKFLDFAVKNTDQGGFHRPEDANQYRTGVPIFVLLRKDGSVAARFTRFASYSPMTADRDSFNNYIKRFDEMLAIASSSGVHADAGEIENNFPGENAVPFKANGGTASNELCNADSQDAFKLIGVGGNADQEVVVRGKSAAQVEVQIWRKESDGGYKAVGDASKGKLSEGIVLTQSFTEAGDYYALVKAADIGAGEFAAASSVSNNFIGYEISGSTVLVPQEDRATATAPEGSDKVKIRFAKDVIYCVVGIATNENPFLVEVAAAAPFLFVKSSEAGDKEVKISTGLGGEISYQLWKPGKIGFVETERTVAESVNDLDDDWVEFEISRTEGKSGRVKARVTIDSSRTTMDANRQYVFETNALNACDFVWEDGVTSNMTARVKILDDEYFDGDYQIAFNLEVLASDAEDVAVAEGKSSFVLTVAEDDKDTPGRAMVSATEPECAKKGTVYVREGEGAKIWVERIEASSGLVKAEIVSSVAGTTFATEDPRDMTNDNGRVYIWWSSREMTRKYVQVGNVPAGKTARIQLKSVGNFKVVSASNAVSVVSVADDAPQFAQPTYSFDLYRYLEAGESVRAGLDASMLKGGKVAFTKLSGTLPAGLKASYDESSMSLSFTGKVTAKPGVYRVAYQVVETRSGVRVPGLASVVTFTVIDPTDVSVDPASANSAVSVTRTIRDMPVINPDTRRLVGILQLTIPKKGNVSGKYVSENGTVALSTKCWHGFDTNSLALTAYLSNAKQDVNLTVVANDDFSIEVLVDDVRESDTLLEAYSDGQGWAAEVAPDWAGYYTVALPVEAVVTNAIADLAPSGSGYLTLDLTGKSQLKSATFKWAGILPNGTAVSGCSVMGAPYAGKSAVDADCNWANLPIFKHSGTDTLSTYLRIRDKANSEEVKASDRRVVWAVEDVKPYWKHRERNTSAADYQVELGAYGAIYDKSENLGACCLEFYKTSEMKLDFDVSRLGWTAFGEPFEVMPVMVEVSESAIAADQDDLKNAGVSMAFNRPTGVVSGSLKINCSEKSVSAKYKGVILTGWGESCCGIAAGLKEMPFVVGSYFFADKVDVGGKKLSVKRGGAMTVDGSED